MTILLANTYAIKYSFINEKFAEIVYQVLKIKPKYLIQPKQILGLNYRATKPIIHTIYPISTTSIHTKSLALLLITKFKSHLIILG